MGQALDVGRASVEGCKLLVISGRVRTINGSGGKVCSWRG